MPLTTQFSRLVPLTLILLGLVSYNFMSAQWTGPTATPPNINTAAPINVSISTQSKLGNFNANILSAATSAWSPRYCDEFGANCSTAVEIRASTLAGSGAFYYNVATARSAGWNTAPNIPSIWPGGVATAGPESRLPTEDVVVNFADANYNACFLTTSLTYARNDDTNTAAGGCVLQSINATTGAWRLTAKAQKRTATECAASCIKF